MGEFSDAYSTDISCPPAVCFATLVDFERYPAWSSPISVCRVIERHPDGLAKLVEFELNMLVKTIRYVLDYTYDPPNGAEWTMAEGDLTGIAGSYRFEETRTGCRATCMQTIELGFWVPAFVKRTFEQKALEDSVEEFRRAVEALG